MLPWGSESGDLYSPQIADGLRLVFLMGTHRGVPDPGPIQAAQQIIELQEAAQINAGLQPTNLGRNNSLHDMKTVVKTWRNRLPIVSDDLSHWSSVFMWRQHHYQGKPTWSGMHSSCNFPDARCPGFMSRFCCVFFFSPLSDVLFSGRFGQWWLVWERQGVGSERWGEPPNPLTSSS